MQGKADETERPRVWPGATVGSVKSEWESRISPASLRGEKHGRPQVNGPRVNIPTDIRRNALKLCVACPKGWVGALQGASKSAYF
jgi:hypothetical protein